MSVWWDDPSLKAFFDPEPIDRHWNWNEIEIENQGHILPSLKVGAITGDGYVQGAMLISTEPVTSEADPTNSCLLIELLFTAPHNRSNLRKDGSKYFAEVGAELIRWAIHFSKQQGCKGRLRLDASPAYIGWYRMLGFREIPIEVVQFEGVQYLPMELPADNPPRPKGVK